MRKLAFLLLLIPSLCNSQSKEMELFPGGKSFIPVRAAVFEPQIGAKKNLNGKDLELHIGASLDVLKFQIAANPVYFGTEFFTFSNLRSEPGFKFPVDAIDYFFGIYFSNKIKISDFSNISSRFRISHISSHFEDGHIGIPVPAVVYSREFIELDTQYEILPSKLYSLKGGLKIQYLFHSIPEEFGKFNFGFNAQFEYFISPITSLYLSNELLTADYDSDINLNNNFEAGLSITKLNKAFIIYSGYYSGMDYKGQYYDQTKKNSFLGFKIIF